MEAHYYMVEALFGAHSRLHLSCLVTILRSLQLVGGGFILFVYAFQKDFCATHTRQLIFHDQLLRGLWTIFDGMCFLLVDCELLIIVI